MNMVNFEDTFLHRLNMKQNAFKMLAEHRFKYKEMGRDKYYKMKYVYICIYIYLT